MNLFFIILILLCIFIASFKKNKWASILVLLPLVSILAGLLLDYKMRDSIEGFFAVILICVELYLITSPWNKLKLGSTIINDYGDNLKKYSNIVIFLGIFAVVFFTPVVIVLSKLGVDPNEFKYEGGIDDFFKSPSFPIPFKIFILITFIADISIIALPLHFYYLTHGKGKQSLLALVASFAYVMRGLTYFSRALPIQYIMLYGMLFLLFRNNIPSPILKKLRVLITIGIVALLINMVGISKDRFEKNYSFNQTEYAIDKEKYINDPVIVSYLDYLSQGYYNCYDLLVRYDGRTFHGQTMFNDVLLLMNQYLGFPFSKDEYLRLREKLWPGLWNQTFNSYVAYMVYDLGIIGSLFFSIFYYLITTKFIKRGKKDSVNFSRLTWITFLLQVPLYSIFYSVIQGLLIPMIFYAVLDLFLRPRRVKLPKQPAQSLQ